MSLARSQSPELDPTPDLEIIDPEALDYLRSYNPEGEPILLKEMIRLFTESTPTRISIMDKALLDQNFKTIKIEAHTLKSSCANLGANLLASICQEIEDISESENSERLGELAGKLAHEYMRAEKVLLDCVKE
jgi:two-component system sensor histidine kinase/response regulator